MNREYIEIRGARAHNLKGIDIDIPRGELVVVTGLSGSGKSSLAFDTIYAEGQRRYMDTLSPYAKHFMGILEKPEVEEIKGLSPIIAIEQKTTGNNPRSTVGTITEVYDFLRLLFARASRAYSPESGKEMVRYTDEQIVDLIIRNFSGRKCYLLAPLVRGRKGHYKELFEQLRRRGFIQARIDGEIVDLAEVSQLDRYKNHFIELVVDRLKPEAGDEELWAALELAQIADFLREKPEGLDFKLEPAATNISGGQKQRLAIARALLKDAPIYVFDDSFSALDFLTEAKVRKAMNEKLAGRTRIVITQRVVSAMHCDRIFVLSDGALVGAGTHTQLLESCPIYREIYLSQTGGEAA